MTKSARGTRVHVSDPTTDPPWCYGVKVERQCWCCTCGEVVGQGAGPLEGGQVVGVVGEVGGVQHQGVGQLVGGPRLQQRAPVQHAANRRWLQRKIFRRCVKIFALPAGGAGGLLLDPLAGDVEEVGVVVRVGGVVAGAGQRPRLVAVARRAAALAVLVIPDQVNIFYEYF